MKTKAKHLLNLAKQSKKAIGAFNVSSIEALQAVFEAASEVKSPVIIQTSAGEAEYLLPELVSEICTELSKLYKVDFLLHLDRGNDIDLIKRCLEAGYDSISSEFHSTTYDEIVKNTLSVRRLTNQYVAYHEGAIEVVPLRYYKEKYQEELRKTDPKLAKRFVQETGIDSLVVCIGNQSGKLKTQQPLDINILTELNDLLPETPFVLHGGSFLSDTDILNCIQNGVAKINVNTEIRLAYINKLKENISINDGEYAPYRLLKGVKEDMRNIIKNKITLFNHL